MSGYERDDWEDRRGLARRDHPWTAIKTASDILPNTGTARRKVYDYIDRPQGATDDEVQEGLRMNPSTQRPRRVELVNQGLVRDSGAVRMTRYGHEAIVWEVA